MPSFKYVFTASVMAFFASTNAHMILQQPPPYGTPNSSPLEAQGADFPCKATSNTGGLVTNMAIGSQQKLQFKGSAVHGGGSCQVSLTTDTPATKNSKWMVIHSIEGGCPARNAGGNEGENADQIDADEYAYTIPTGITPGAYTLAWTWFNKIGNREMYMNCASIKVTAGSSKRDTALNETAEYGISDLEARGAPTFPAMFVANIPTTDCESVDSTNVKFPDPGSSIETAGGPSASLTPPTGPKCAAAGAGAAAAAPSGSSGSAAPAGSSAPSAAAGGSSGSGSGASPAASSAPSAAAGGSSGSASAGTPDSQSAAPGGASAAAPSVAAPVIAAPAASAAAPSAAGNSSGSGSGSASGAAPAAAAAPSTPAAAGSSTGTCTQPGQSICSPDGKQIGTCTQSNTVTWIPVAAGTKCSGGLMVMAGSKRSAKFPPDYVRRSLAGNFGA